MQWHKSLKKIKYFPLTLYFSENRSNTPTVPTAPIRSNGFFKIKTTNYYIKINFLTNIGVIGSIGTLL
jgi:hypothetical protein